MPIVQTRKLTPRSENLMPKPTQLETRSRGLDPNSPPLFAILKMAQGVK